MKDSLERLYQDRDECEREAEVLEEEMAEIERSNPDYDNDESWEALHNEINELYNHAQYLTHCMEYHETTDL